MVGIEYESIEEDRGYLTIRRKVSITELVEEIQKIMLVGSHFPQFPPAANPTVTYAWDLNNPEDGDCHHEIMARVDKDYREEMKY